MSNGNDFDGEIFGGEGAKTLRVESRVTDGRQKNRLLCRLQPLEIGDARLAEFDQQHVDSLFLKHGE